jgi:hypothetical protein
MISIKRATKDDIDVLYELIIGIAKHHNQEQYVLTNKKEMLKSIAHGLWRTDRLI